MPIGFGIIGTGMISRFHARALAEVRGAKLVACFDRNPERAAALAQDAGCTAHATLDALLDDLLAQVGTITG